VKWLDCSFDYIFLEETVLKILVTYATSEGHTRKIGRQVTDRIANAVHAVELLDLGNVADIELRRFDGAILAASVHMGHYQRSLTDFVAKQFKTLKEVPTLFLSVSLSAAGHDTEDWSGLDRIMTDFVEATGWTPDRVEQVAGAYMPSQYDIFRRFIMRRIIATKDAKTDLSSDHDYTDWRALDRIIDDWINSLKQ
jgi:menaquinone-dependent protoporphyrinogen oxidase